MSLSVRHASSLTVRTPGGEREFRDVSAEVEEGVLKVSRAGRPLSWFAAGQWTEVSFL